MKMPLTAAKTTFSTDDVPSGYKRTEVGIIPVDWEIMPLAELCPPQGIVRGPFGGTLKKEYFVDSGYLVYEQRNAIYKTSAIGRYYITHSKFNEMLRFRVSPKDFIISCSGTIGRIFQIPPDAPAGIINQALLKIRTDDDVISDRFFYLVFEWDSFQARIIDSTQGGAMQNLVGMVEFKKTPFIVPPIPEQRAIATALSDVDELIDALDKLIAKKRDIKQATMQQLLTGKTRLPGFSEEWEVKRLGDLITFIATANNPRADLNDYGDVEYIHYGDIHSHTLPVLDCRNSTLPRIDQKKARNITLLENGDLVIADASEDLEGVGKSIEVQGVDGRQVIAGLHTILCRGNPGQWAAGFKAYLQFIPAFKSALVRAATGISVYAVSKKQIADVELALPSVKEQQAIAAILSDMDTEIVALEQRLEKTRQIKQGMMQQLLTGRVRLVQPKEAEATP